MGSYCDQSDCNMTSGEVALSGGREVHLNCSLYRGGLSIKGSTVMASSSFSILTHSLLCWDCFHTQTGYWPHMAE